MEWVLPRASRLLPSVRVSCTKLTESACARVWRLAVDEAVQLVMAALQLRAQDSTVRNQTSSRSHAFVRLQVVQPFAGADGRGLSGTLYLVDLAGSESISHASSNEQQRETVHINRSLSALGRVVCNMSAQAPHIPYRDSLLTKARWQRLESMRAQVARLLLHICVTRSLHYTQIHDTVPLSPPSPCAPPPQVLQEGLDPNNARVALITTGKTAAQAEARTVSPCTSLAQK